MKNILEKLKQETILVLGWKGFVGKNLCDYLEKHEISFFRNNEWDDLRNKEQVQIMFETFLPTLVLNCSGRTYGIAGNVKFPVDLLEENLLIQYNLMTVGFLNNVNITSIGAGCAYPEQERDLTEDDLWNGLPQKDSICYSLTKSMLSLHAMAYKRQYPQSRFNPKVIVPGNIYGPYDMFDLDYAHVIPALVHKAVLYKKNQKSIFEIWGREKAERSFLYVEDFIKAMLLVAINGFKGDTYIYSNPESVKLGEVVQVLAEIADIKERDIIWNTLPAFDGQIKRSFNIHKIMRLKDSSAIKNFTFLSKGLRNTFDYLMNAKDARLKIKNQFKKI